MRRMLAHVGRTLAVAASAAVLVLAGACDPQEADPFGGCEQHPGQCGKKAYQPPADAILVRTDLSAMDFWPSPADGVPACSDCVVRYELTADYWARLRGCLADRPFAECADTVPAEYRAYRTE